MADLERADCLPLAHCWRSSSRVGQRRARQFMNHQQHLLRDFGAIQHGLSTATLMAIGPASPPPQLPGAISCTITPTVAVPTSYGGEGYPRSRQTKAALTTKF